MRSFSSSRWRRTSSRAFSAAIYASRAAMPAAESSADGGGGADAAPARTQRHMAAKTQPIARRPTAPISAATMARMATTEEPKSLKSGERARVITR